MNINFKKLYVIIEGKTNRAIDKLEELKCTTADYKTTMDAILYNIDAFAKIKANDIDCPDCKKSLEIKELNSEIKFKKDEHIIKEENKTSLIGKKWIPYKGPKGDK
jgi:hypothetical protein